jgi:hypothetical protein
VKYRVEFDTCRSIKTCMRFVEQPHLSAPHDQRGKGGSTSLSRRQCAYSRRGDSPIDLQSLQRIVYVFVTCAGETSSELQVLASSQIGIQAVAVAEQADMASHSGAVLAEVNIEDMRGAARQRHQPRAETKQRRFAGSVGPAKCDQFASPDREIHPSQCREAAECHDRIGEPNRRVVRRHCLHRCALNRRSA